tara:strand:+ start:105 stop:1280 length:1176 start_codon:yes stop_codon:yes gene_type:complete
MCFRNLMIALVFALGLAACATRSDDDNARNAVETVLAEFRSAHAVPGITASIVMNDGRSVTAASGFSDLEAQTLMTPGTPMLAASIGKTFVAATVLSLAAEGRLNLDGPVSLYLSGSPWYHRLPNGETMTVRHLLTHSSGLPDHVFQPEFGAAITGRSGSDSPPFRQEELVGFVLDKKALFPAGESWAYTDTGYILLGLIIEHVTGHAWTDEVEARFLQPLKLDATQPSNRKDLPGLAAGYLAPDNPFGLPEKTVGQDGNMVWNPALEDAGGGFASTSLDLARWGSKLYQGKAMPSDYLPDLLNGVSVEPGGSTHLYGAGVSIVKQGPFGPVYGHAGLIPGYVSSLRYYPEFGASIAFQINTDIGLADGPGNPVPELENELAQIAKDWALH